MFRLSLRGEVGSLRGHAYHAFARVGSVVARAEPAKELRVGMLRYGAAHSSALFLGVASQVLLARWLGIRHYGLFSLAVTVAGVTSYIVTLGLPTILTRFFPEYADRADWARARGLVRAAVRLTIVGSLAAMVLIALALVLVRQRVADQMAIDLALLLIPLLALQSVFTALLQAEKRWSASFFPSSVIAPVTFLLAALIMRTVIDDLTIIHLIGAMLIGNVVALTVQLYFVRSVPFGKYGSEAPVDESGMWLKAALPILLMTVFVIVMTRADLFFVDIFATRIDVGIYAAILSVAELLELFSDAADSVASPDMGPLYEESDRTALQSLLNAVVQASFVPTVLGFLLLVVFGRELLHVFGSGFERGYTALLIMAFAQVVKGASGAPGYLLIMSGNQSRVGGLYAVTVLIDIPLLFFFTRAWGLTGAALASLITVAASRLVLNALARRDTKLGTSIFAVAFAPRADATATGK